MVNLEKQNYDENKSIFVSLSRELRRHLTSVHEIEHVGSTAIPEIEYGKNIIDILIGVDSENSFQKTYNELIALGYYPSKNTESNIYHFFASSDRETHSGDVHIHLCMEHTDRHDEFLILRDYLLANVDEACKYSDYKLRLLEAGYGERSDYRREKSKYVTDLISRAKAYQLKSKE